MSTIDIVRQLPRLFLLPGFRLIHEDQEIPITPASQRVLAFLALHRRPVLRTHIGGSLWPDVSDQRASASLRSAMWRTPAPGGHVLIATSNSHAWLAPELVVDFREMDTAASALMAGDGADRAVNLDPWALNDDLLMDWCEDWVLVERERYRQLRMHTLESICEQHTRLGRYAEAMQAGLMTVAAEPLRESAHRQVIKAHLSKGNRAQAIYQYHSYRRLLDDAFGLPPSPAMEELMSGLLHNDIRT